MSKPKLLTFRLRYFIIGAHENNFVKFKENQFWQLNQFRFSELEMNLVDSLSIVFVLFAIFILIMAPMFNFGNMLVWILKQ